MNYFNRKPKSFLYSFSWVGIMLLCMGVAFLAVGFIMLGQSPEDMNLRVNGVRKVITADNVWGYRLLFLLTFGIPGFIMAAIGAVILLRKRAFLNRVRDLKEYGVKITADLVGCEMSCVRVNRRYLERLSCKYTDDQGITYIFKSGFVRRDPTLFISKEKVTVYHDYNDMKRYFVDVDDSAGVGTKVVEL